MRIRERDGAAIYGEVELTSGKKLEIPTFFPVINPNIPVISPREIYSEFSWPCLITNAYILYKKGVEEDIHRFLDFPGVVMMDSGAYQWYVYGRMDVENREIVDFVNRVKPDIATFLDVIVPWEFSRSEAERASEVTERHAREAMELGDPEITWLATVQGGRHLDLVEKNAQGLKAMDFGYYAVGSLVPQAIRWSFTEQVDYFVTALKVLPRSKPVHFWGLGHPAVLSLFVLMGASSFDSASYVLYARDNRIMTPEGTLSLEDVEDLPPSKYLDDYTKRELLEMDRSERTRILAKHNLYEILAEIRRIREAIRGNYLWELVQQRVRAHPGLLLALRRLLEKHRDYMEELTPFTRKSGILWLGEETGMRPEVTRARERISGIDGPRYRKVPYGEVPVALKYVFPFGQTEGPGEEPPDPDPVEWIRALLKYQFGLELRGEVEVDVAKTGMIRSVRLDGEVIGTVRRRDGLFVPNIRGGEAIVKGTEHPRNRIVVKEEAVPFVSKGRTLFTKFAEEWDPDLRAKQEVVLVDPDGNVIATGTSLLSAREIPEFPSHPLVRPRHHL